MVSRQEAQRKWRTNFEGSIDEILSADNAGDEDAYLAGVSAYLGSDVSNNEDAQEVAQSFANAVDGLTADEIERLIVDRTPGANSLDQALSQLSDDWDSNYADAYGL